MKLHLGCGTNIKQGYINIDAFVISDEITNADILNLPYSDGSVVEILTEHLFEHIPYEDEPKIFKECYRLLIRKGKLIVEVPDMEWLCKRFLEAEDDFKEFYKVGAIDHYFGNNKSVEQRWGIITTHFFGNQNGEGQFHYNGYTKDKLIQISKLVGFSACSVIKIFNKGAQALVATFVK